MTDFFLAYAGTVCDTGFGVNCTEYREADSDLPSDSSYRMGYVIIIFSYMKVHAQPGLTSAKRERGGLKG